MPSTRQSTRRPLLAAGRFRFPRALISPDRFACEATLPCKSIAALSLKRVGKPPRTTRLNRIEWDKFQDFGHSHWHNSLIWGENIENVAIVGGGLISGKALTRGERGGGDKAIALKLCHNVTFRDFSIASGGHFGILVTGVDNLTIDNVKIDTNRDGIDVDSCRNVRISNCSVNTPNDDAIVLKGTHALGAARSTENVTIANCLVSGYDIGSLLDATYKRTVTRAPDRDGPTGRVKIGTESEGDFRNITISECGLRSLARTCDRKCGRLEHRRHCRVQHHHARRVQRAYLYPAR